MRFVVSFVLGCTVVFLMLLTGLALFGVFEEDDPPPLLAYPVDPLTTAERRALKEVFGEEINQPSRPRPAPNMSRDITGFVQLEVLVADDGTVAGAKVLGATPAGVYEDQALQDILKRRFLPLALESTDGNLRTIVETVEFSIPDESSTN